MVSIVNFGFLTHFAARKRRYTAHASCPQFKNLTGRSTYIPPWSSFVSLDSCWQRAGRGDLDLEG
jgi:hypothetical protein